MEQNTRFLKTNTAIPIHKYVLLGIAPPPECQINITSQIKCHKQVSYTLDNFYYEQNYLENVQKPEFFIIVSSTK